MDIVNELNAIITIAFRDIKKLLRSKTRIIVSLIFPLTFIGILGNSLNSNLGDGVEYNLLVFTFTGVIGQTIFQSTASGIVSLIEDRQNNFAQELFVAPISRFSLLIGKIIGESAVSYLQVFGIMIIGGLLGIPITIIQVLSILVFSTLVAIFGGSFGILVLGSFLEQKTANQFFPFVLFPQIFLAGVFAPINELPFFLSIVTRIVPMTYAVDFTRHIYYYNSVDKDLIVINSLLYNVLIILAMSAVFLTIGTIVFNRRQRNI